MSRQVERPTKEQREAVAKDINAGGPAADEVIMEEIGLAPPTILDEARAEQAEGGGPIADAVEGLDRKLDGE